MLKFIWDILKFRIKTTSRWSGSYFWLSRGSRRSRIFLLEKLKGSQHWFVATYLIYLSF